MTSAEVERWRLFVAIPVPPDVRALIQRTQHLVREHLPKAGISWTRPEQFHLTLKFLGDVPSDSVSALTDALRSATGDFAPLALESRGLGFFPNARAPRVLWAGITDMSHQLDHLQAKIEKACSGFNAEPAEPRFHAHVTLARVKRFQDRAGGDLANTVALHQDQKFGAWAAPHIELIRSQLSNAGPAYTTLASLPMSKA